VNPVVKALLRSPLHRLAGKNLILLTVTGRKSGRTYTVPVGRHELPTGTFVIFAAGAWRHNLRGGADVQVVLDGQTRAGHVVPEDDPDRAAEVFKTMLDRTGARAVGVKVNVDRPPTVEEIKPAIAARTVGYLQLED
jgi:hypothetical protein